MSIITREEWQCDGCGANGGPVDANRTYPPLWLRMDVLLAVPQLVSEQQRERILHYCRACARDLICDDPVDPAYKVSPVVEELRALWRRGGGT